MLIRRDLLTTLSLPLPKMYPESLSERLLASIMSYVVFRLDPATDRLRFCCAFCLIILLFTSCYSSSFAFNFACNSLIEFSSSVMSFLRLSLVSFVRV